MTPLFQSTRPARGATRRSRQTGLPQIKFQSTRPARGATFCHICGKKQMQISIHAPREGRDDWLYQVLGVHCYFNPRAPRGARPICGSP